MIQKGKVILAGAGPGDPELITMKAVRFLQQADVVLTDRLVSTDIIDQHTNVDAEIIFAGKQSGREGSISQSSINELMVEHALQNKLVVRLKGGDVSVFSNILNELQVLVENNIPYEIVPGITAAHGAAAYAGIPLTARGYSNGCRILTYYDPELFSADNWRDLSQTDDTLVFYMSSENLDSLVANLVKYNIAADKLLAVIEQATTPLQHITVANLYEYQLLSKGKRYVSPTLVIIGKVVGLHEQFAWLNNKYCTDFYFKPVSGNMSDAWKMSDIAVRATPMSDVFQTSEISKNPPNN